MDPIAKKFAYLTPYQFASNTPIVAIDMDGLEAFIIHEYYNKSGQLIRISILRFTDLEGNAINTHPNPETNMQIRVEKHFADGRNEMSFSNVFTQVQSRALESNVKKTPINSESQIRAPESKVVVDGFKVTSELILTPIVKVDGILVKSGAKFYKEGVNAIISAGPITNQTDGSKEGDLVPGFKQYLNRLAKGIEELGSISKITVEMTIGVGPGLNDSQLAYVNKTSNIALRNINSILKSSGVNNISTKLNLKSDSTGNCKDCGVKIKID